MYVSVCSGIEAATVAWHGLGWSPVAFSEIEPFPSRVLAHHYPTVPNLGDMTKYKEWKIERPNLLVGGTPCQSFSIAGLRKGLDDPRGNLMLTYLGIADAFKPEWIVWENVPGVLSSNGGRDFGTFLQGLAQLGYGFAYRVLDAQYVRTHEFYGAVPQRRRRVFVVGHLGDWRRAAAVLFDSESMRGNPPPRREAGKGVASDAARGTYPCGGIGSYVSGDVSSPLLRTGADLGPGCETLVSSVTGRVTHSLRAEGCDASEDGTGRGMPIIARSLAIRGRDGAPQAELGDDVANMILTPNGGRAGIGVGAVMCMSHGQANAEISVGAKPTLNCNHEQPIALVGNTIGRQPHNGGNGTGLVKSGAMYTLTKTDIHAVAFAQNSRDEVRLIGGNGGVVGALAAQAGMKQTSYVASHMQVRRLTLLECERLQGFPDQYTNIPSASDTARYKALGNSMACNVMQIIGQRIAMVNAL